MPKREPLEKTCTVCGKPFLCGGRGRPRVTQERCSITCQQTSRFRRGAVAETLDPSDAAYLAGLIDGEGSIMLTNRATHSVHIRLSISNTHMPVLEWTAATTNVGAIYRHREADELHKASYSWRCHGDGAESVIRQVEPFLHIKGPQARLALDHHAALRDPARKADRTWQQENLLRMKVMNRRGGVTKNVDLGP